MGENHQHGQLPKNNLLLQQQQQQQKQQKKNGYDNNDPLFDKKIALAAERLEPFFEKILRERTSRENALVIAEYIAESKREVNLSIGYIKSNIHTLVDLSEFHSNRRNFREEMTREDLLQYLDSLRRPEASDPLHKWIGTYNLRKMLPKEYGSGSTCHRRFQKWTMSKVFEKLWIRLLQVYDDIRGIRWKWLSLDSVSIKAPLGGT
jgi:hypothetical protein